MTKIISSIIVIILIYLSGAVSYHFYRGTPEPTFKIIDQGDVIYKPVVRNIYKMPRNKLLDELSAYDQSPTRLEIIQIDNKTIKAIAGLHKREWSREAKLKIEVAKTTNWKLYIGIGSGILLAGGIAGFLLARKR